LHRHRRHYYHRSPSSSHFGQQQQYKIRNIFDRYPQLILQSHIIIRIAIVAIITIARHLLLLWPTTTIQDSQYLRSIFTIDPTPKYHHSHRRHRHYYHRSPSSSLVANIKNTRITISSILTIAST
jgi:hypothetical protein